MTMQADFETRKRGGGGVSLPVMIPVLRIRAWLRRRHGRVFALLIADAVLVSLSYFAAFWFRFDLSMAAPNDTYGNSYVFATLPWLVAIRLACGWFAKLYHWSFGLASLTEGVNLALSVLIGTLAFAVLGHGLLVFPAPPPRSIYVLEGATTLLGMAAIRFMPRYLFLQYYRHYPIFHKTAGSSGRRTLVYGAGGNAELLVRELSRTRGHGCHIVGLIDDDPGRWNSRIHGFRVWGGIEVLEKVLERQVVEQVFLAIPTIGGRALRRIVDICGPHGATLKILPSYNRLLEAGSPLEKLENIRPEALLERRPVDFDANRMLSFLSGKNLLVTGAAGSIGSELCRKSGHYGIRKLVLLDLNENDLMFLQAELRERYPELEVILEIGSIQDRGRMDDVIGRYRPNLIFHAAAHKHVHLMEHSPLEAVKNNVLGTWTVAESAMANGVERMVLISTDKAVASGNVMGASKRLSERVVRHCNGNGTTRFSIVRFGNVLGSSGSLLQIVKRQIDMGGPITVTHPDMIRYFMTIPEAAGLVLVSAALDEGEISILDMGEPVRVDALVRQIVYLSGLIPGKDVEIRYTSPRPGEKLREELLAAGEVLRSSSFPRINIAETEESLDDVPDMLRSATRMAATGDAAFVRVFLRAYVSDYWPI